MRFGLEIKSPGFYLESLLIGPELRVHRGIINLFILDCGGGDPPHRLGNDSTALKFRNIFMNYQK